MYSKGSWMLLHDPGFQGHHRISITEGKTNDKIILDELILGPGVFYIMDRGFY